MAPRQAHGEGKVDMQLRQVRYGALRTDLMLTPGDDRCGR